MMNHGVNPGMLPAPRKRPFSAVDLGGPADAASDLSHLFPDFPVTPWISRQEWMDVYKRLVPVLDQPENLDRLNALDVEHVGHIIESCWEKAWGCPNETASVTVLILKALKALHTSDPTTAAMAAQMAVIRFVKAVSEPKRNDMHRRPIMEICKLRGVPPWIVRIRHDGSHGDMHESHVVKDALVFALRWLKDRFWDVEARRINQPHYMMKMGDDKTVESSENIVRLALRKLCKDMKTRKRQHLQQILQHDLDVVIENHLSCFTAVLAGEFLAPHTIPLDAEDDPEGPTGRNRVPCVPQKLLDDWNEVLDHLLSHPGATDSILRSFAALLGNTDSYRDYLIAAWIHSILSRIPKNHVSSVRIWDAVNWSSLCETVTSKPSPYSTGILQLLTSWVSNSAEHKFIQDSIRLSKIMSPMTAGSGAAQTSPEYATKTVASLLDVAELRTGAPAVSETVSPSPNPWRLATEINWTNCPIGLLPHQNVPGFDLYSCLLLPDVPNPQTPKHVAA